jgi:hypothetical protein
VPEELRTLAFEFEVQSASRSAKTARSIDTYRPRSEVVGFQGGNVVEGDIVIAWALVLILVMLGLLGLSGPGGEPGGRLRR